MTSVVSVLLKNRPLIIESFIFILLQLCLALQDVIQDAVSTVAGYSAGALRVVSTGANIAGTFTGDHSLTDFAGRAEATAKLLDQLAEGGGATSTRTDSAAAAAAQISNAPAQEDPAVAPAPQLAETTDPVKIHTRPEVPATEYEGQQIQSVLVDPYADADFVSQAVLTRIGETDIDILSHIDPEELEEMITELENYLRNPLRLIIVGTSIPPIRHKQKPLLLQPGKFAPAS